MQTGEAGGVSAHQKGSKFHCRNILGKYLFLFLNKSLHRWTIRPKKFLCHDDKHPMWLGALFAVLRACNLLLWQRWATESAGCHPVSCTVLAGSCELERGCLQESSECLRVFVCAACSALHNTNTTEIVGKFYTSWAKFHSSHTTRDVDECPQSSKSKRILVFIVLPGCPLVCWRYLISYLRGIFSSKLSIGNILWLLALLHSCIF